MKYGVNMFIWTASYDGSQAALLPPLKQAGFDSIEVPIFRPHDFAASAIRRSAESNGLELTAVSVLTGGTNLISEDGDVRKRTVAHMKDCIAAVSEAGLRIMAGPLYSPVGYLPGRRRTSDEWSWAVDGYQQLGDTLKKHGVTIAVEPLNRFETYFLNTAADAVAFADQVNHPNVGLLIDTFHSNIEEKDVPDAYRTAARHLKHVHTCENDRGTPGSGHIDWTGVFQALREIGYDGNLTIESFGFSLGEISAAASIWRDLAPTPDSIAIEGVKFLKKMTA
jgi:D-psicose/D-tagatose/L-ribulose 3-epimerase